jgi:hypothetical protein
MQRAFQVALLILSLAAVGCSEEMGDHATFPVGNDFEFTDVVLPVLQRDCGFQTCHGSPERFFRVYGPGRTRLPLDPTMCTDKLMVPPCNFDDLNGNERDYSRMSAQSMIDIDNPADSLLLRKPLAVEAGGSDHEGVDKFGRNVYRTQNDEGWKIILRWVTAAAPRMFGTQAPAAPAPLAP